MLYVLMWHIGYMPTKTSLAYLWRMLRLSLAHVVFKWEPGFEELLRERKKRESGRPKYNSILPKPLQEAP